MPKRQKPWTMDRLLSRVRGKDSLPLSYNPLAFENKKLHRLVLKAVDFGLAKINNPEPTKCTVYKK